MNKIKDLETIKEIKQGLDHILKTRTTKEAAEWVNANYKEKYLDEFCRFCCFEQSKTTIKLNLGHLRELFREYKTNKEVDFPKDMPKSRKLLKYLRDKADKEEVEE